jgi:hypothetical protein
MIKRFVSLVVLLFALSLPAFGGHVRVGSGLYCEGNCTGKACPVCGDPCAGRSSSEPPTDGSLIDGLPVLAFGLFIARKRRM